MHQNKCDTKLLKCVMDLEDRQTPNDLYKFKVETRYAYMGHAGPNPTKEGDFNATNLIVSSVEFGKLRESNSGRSVLLKQKNARASRCKLAGETQMIPSQHKATAVGMILTNPWGEPKSIFTKESRGDDNSQESW